MNDDERMRREDAARTRSNRGWSNLYRGSDSWDFRDPGARPAAGQAAPDGGAWREVVAHGVDLGYRVAEEQIAQGRRVAEQWNRRSYDPSAMRDDVREVGERMFRYYADLGALWLDFLGGLIGNAAGVRYGPGAWQPGPGPSASHAPAGDPVAVTIDVTATRPTQVTLDLKPVSARSALLAQPLHALEPGKPPLTEVGFEHDGHQRLRLRIRVPETQPPGLYVGAVVDRHGGEPRGTLSVQVGT